MKAVAGRAEGRTSAAEDGALGPDDRAGLRSMLAFRLAGPAGSSTGTVAERTVPTPNGARPAVTQAVAAPPDDVRRHALHPIDIHVGGRMRLRRRLLGMSQTKLAMTIGSTFQQVQKFERGLSRIAASRLHDVSRALDVPVSFFFDAFPAESGGLAVASPGQEYVEARNNLQRDEMHGRETVDLMRAYYTLADPAVRKRILELVRSLAPAG